MRVLRLDVAAVHIRMEALHLLVQLVGLLLQFGYFGDDRASLRRFLGWHDEF